MDFISGEILSFDKPYGWTSFDIVGKIRWLICKQLGINKLKVGHAGTLDPLATGVVIICTGRSTKQIEELQSHTKEYVATLQLGATTPSFDLEHPVDKIFPTEHISEVQITHVLKQFEGEIEQVPPIYSAVKVSGKRAYHYARQGAELELRPKKIRIEQIEILSFDPKLMQLKLRIVCSKGTYIRALARDIGEALGSGAYLTALRRTRIGEYKIEDSMTIEQFELLLKGESVIQENQ